MKNLSFLSVLALAAVPHVSAHYFFPHFIANGNFTGYYEYVREDTQSYMPMKGQYASNDFRCNTGSQDFAAKTGVYKVKAGDEIGFGTDFNALIQHPGPLQVYMSKSTTDDVRDYDGSGDWFKIYELGPQDFSNNGITWGVTDIGNFTFPLPKEVPAGQYLVRIEHIGVHGAGEWGGAEVFFNCAQVEVESDSTVSPGPTVKIPGVYDGYEPGILFYMYRDTIVNYTMPGPRPFPDAALPNVAASGVSVAPTATPWTLPAVTRYASSAAASYATASSKAVVSGLSSVSRLPASSTSTPLRATSSVDYAAKSADIAVAAESSPVFAFTMSTDPAVPATTEASLVPTSSDATCGPRFTVTVHETVTVPSSKPTCGATITVTATVTTTIAPTSN
ncbi:Glycoside hydrolase family 61 [Penicillium nucicola]|uniref:Glycoside hydrolase family 61 n=1 Tax=Penicillium nucicola TaxID=1850975 RepID=UPI002544D78E|nr:Glycoside hydrolase family 61 [Penicillium nucicola]KAJ5762394.1 Glycoside hydrolase family 61 [Penicillium nucicola]